MKDQPHRRKIILKWNADDVVAVYRTLFEQGQMGMWMDMPSADYAIHPYDRVERDGRLVGISGYPLYSANERAYLSVSVVDAAFAEPGTELSLLWGEPAGGTRKPSVHDHRQMRIRCEARPWPIFEVARLAYRSQA